MSSQHTPLPWRVREHPENPDEFHISGKTPKFHPYFGVTDECEIMSDEDYPRKRADAEFIVKAVNEYAHLSSWKSQMMQVFDQLDLQKVGNLLEVGVGNSIADKVVPAIEELVRLRAEIKKVKP